MNPAENTPPTGGSDPAPAAGSELSIPKHRFDEVSAEVRRLREEVSMKDRLYMEDRQRYTAAQRPQAEPENPEEYGLDPQTFQGVRKLAAKMAEGVIKQNQVVFEQQIGMLANRTEKAEFLASHGADKAKHWPDIQRNQLEHAQRTGTFMPAEVAYKLIKNDESDMKIKNLQAEIAALKAGTPLPASRNPEPSGGGVPSAAGTRQIPSAGQSSAAPANKSFSELSLEEMEARLEEQFRAGSTV